MANFATMTVDNKHYHSVLIVWFFRSKNRYLKARRHQVNESEPNIKGYGDFHVNETDNLKPTEQIGIPYYVCNWNKQNPPYISSPTLLTAAGDVDKNQKLLFRNRSSSVGNEETSGHNPDPLSTTYSTDSKTGCDYETQVIWHNIWNH